VEVFEGASAWPGGWVAACEAAGHGVDGGPADHGFGVSGETLVVAGQTVMGGDPGQSALHHPPARLDAEPSLAFGFADDIHNDAQHTGRPFDQPARETGIGEDEAAAASRQVRPSSTLLAPSRSWTLAAHTITVISKPMVSVTMNRLRPLIFLPAS
jgi:hypothetical protein